MFPVTGNITQMGNMLTTESELLARAAQLLTDRLGAGWTLCTEPKQEPGIVRSDAVFRVEAPDSSSALELAEAKQLTYPRDVLRWLQTLEPVSPPYGYLLVAPFLGPMAREMLEAARVSYIDMTGNMLVRTDDPSLFISQQGAKRNPTPREKPERSLRGAKAARVVRALCDYAPPATSKTVAERAGVSPGYVSKIVSLLEREVLIRREGRGPTQPIQDVRWSDVIRRWAADYKLLESNACRLFLAPQGIQAFLRTMEDWASRSGGRYAVTGSFAAAQRAPVAPPSLLFCYVDAPIAVAEEAELTGASSTGNIYLCEPLDPVAFEASWVNDGVRYAALSQVAADCLTGPDRLPAEGEALMDWMAANESSWRLGA